MTNDKQLDRIERMLEAYLRKPRPKRWKQDPRMKILLERQKQFEEERQKKTEDKQSDSTSE